MSTEYVTVKLTRRQAIWTHVQLEECLHAGIEDAVLIRGYRQIVRKLRGALAPKLRISTSRSSP